MNIFVCGEAGSGKDSVAQCLPTHKRLAFGDEVRLMAKNLRVNGAAQAFIQASQLLEPNTPKDLLKMLKKFAGIPKTEKDREILQELGTYMKSIDNEVWIKGTLAKMKPNQRYIITDVRYRDEFAVLKKMGFVGIYIDCPREIRVDRLMKRDGGHNTSSENHKAESQITSLREMCDYRIDNDGEFSELQEKVDVLMEFLRFSKTN